MKNICYIMAILAAVAILCTAQEQPNDEENSILSNDEPDNNKEENSSTTTTSPKPNTPQQRPARQGLMKFISDLFQIPLTLIRTVSNLLSSGLENVTNRNSNKSR